MSLYFIASLAAGFYCFFIASFVLLQGRNQQNTTFASLCYAISLWTSFPWAIQTCSPDHRLILARTLYVAALLVPPLFLAFVQASVGRPLRGGALNLSITASIGVLFLLPSAGFIRDVRLVGGMATPVPGPSYILFVTFFGIICGYAFLLVIHAYRKANPFQKNRLRYIFLSFILAYMSGLMHFVAAYTGREPFPHDLLIVVFASILAYAIIKRRLLIFELVVRDSVAHLLTLCTIGLCAFVLALPAVRISTYTALILGVLLSVVMMDMGYRAIRRAIYPALDRLFFANKYAYLEELSQLPKDMLEFSNLREMLTFLVKRLTEVGRLEHVSVFMYDPGPQTFVESMYHTLRPESEAIERPATQLAQGSPLLRLLQTENRFWIQEELEDMPFEGSQMLIAEMKRLQASACFGVWRGNEIIGVVALGAKVNKEPFNQQDLRILTSLKIRLENFLVQAMTITQEALNMVKDSHDMKNDVNALKGRVTWRAMRIAAWKLEFQKQAEILETLLAGTSRPAPLSVQDRERVRTAFGSLRTQALEWFQEADRSRNVEDQSIQRLAHRLKNWAEYGRVVSEGFHGSRFMAAIDVGDAARLSVERWTPHAEKKNLKLSIEAAPNLVVWGERSLVEQVIENLIDNAIKATQQGTVDVVCRSDREGILIEVRDSGCGIPAEDLPTIFEKPFYQGRGRETLEQSTGVGLYLVSQYVRSLGGRVRAESQVGKGSSFFVHLPRCDRERQNQNTGAAA